MYDFSIMDNSITSITKNLTYSDEFWVVCKDESTLRRLMHDFIECVGQDAVRVDYLNNEVRLGNEVYRFTTCSKQELALKARRTIQVVYDYDFHTAIIEYEAKKLMWK